MSPHQDFHRTFRVTKNRHPRPRTYAALMIDETSGKGEPVRLIQEDQVFSRAAVVWEVANIKLDPLVSNFVPVVTEPRGFPKRSPEKSSNTPEIRQGVTPEPTIWGEIVGYCGWVRGHGIWTQDAPRGHKGDFILGEEWDWQPGDELPVKAYCFFNLSSKVTQQWFEDKNETGIGWTPFYQFSEFFVFCSIHGEVLDILGSRSWDYVTSVDSPLEFVLGGIAAKFAKKIGGKLLGVILDGGRRTLARLGRKVSKDATDKFLRGPDGEVLRSTVEAAMKAPGPTTRVVTLLTEAPQKGKALSVAFGDKAGALASASRGAGTFYFGDIPKALILQLERIGLVRTSTTSMGGVVGPEYRFLGPASEFVVPLLKDSAW